MTDPTVIVSAVEVQVVRSSRRRTTVEATVVDGILRVAIPATMTIEEEQHWVEEMRRRVQRSAARAEIDLTDLADRLAARHGLPRPNEIVWSERQKRRWGSCTPATGRVRISSQVAHFPTWVVEYVIVHELAHLLVANHSPAFWKLVGRYPMAERARGYLLAKAGSA